MMGKLIPLLGLMIALSTALPLSAVPVSMTRKAVTKTVQIAAKRSGRVLTPAARIAMEKAAAKAFAQYGDDVLRALEKGGLEALKQGERHGRDFWKLCSHATPQAARSMALHADTLMPIARRVGKDFVTLEGKVPGLGAECVKFFGDKSAKTLAHAPAGEITQLVGYARRADSPQTAKLLHEAYQKSGGQVLKHLNWKHIMAGGLSAGAVVAAYKLSGGVAQLAETHPESFERIIDKWTWPIPLFLLASLGLAVWFAWGPVARTRKWLCSLIPEPKRKKDESKDKAVPEPVPEQKNEEKEQTI
ncbi:MAG: hypothetical protein E7055_11815 [Lentisphaerae bacterium]|nr:hypothetical protein [Lentisphaerota bacterium]